VKPTTWVPALGVAVAAALGAVASGCGGTLATRLPAADPGRPPEAVPPDVTIIPRGYDARAAFEDLLRKGGPRVRVLGGPRDFLVPADLRFKPVHGKKLVEAVAAEYRLKVAWTRRGKCAVLHAGASDKEVERVRADLASADAAVRQEAAWRGGWLRDARVVPLLIKAAKDTDAEVARQALVGLRRMSWDAVLAADEGARELLAAEFSSPDVERRRELPSLAALLGSDLSVDWIRQWVASIEERLPARDDYERRGAARELGELGVENVGVEKALALIERTFADPDEEVRGLGARALARVGSDLPAPQTEHQPEL